MSGQTLFDYRDNIDYLIQREKLFERFLETPESRRIQQIHVNRITEIELAADKLNSALQDIALRPVFDLEGIIGSLFRLPSARAKKPKKVYKKVFYYAYDAAFPKAFPEGLKGIATKADIDTIMNILADGALIESSYKGIPDLVAGKVCIPFLGCNTMAVDQLRDALVELGYRLSTNPDFKDNDYLADRSHGYYAYHFYVEPPAPSSQGWESQRVMTAEIQVVTLLCNAWTNISHNLSYKPDNMLYLQTLQNHVIDDMDSVCDIIHGVDEIATTMLQRIDPQAPVSNPRRH
jgi:hypothetical protein